MQQKPKIGFFPLQPVDVKGAHHQWCPKAIWWYRGRWGSGWVYLSTCGRRCQAWSHPLQIRYVVSEIPPIPRLSRFHLPQECSNIGACYPNVESDACLAFLPDPNHFRHMVNNRRCTTEVREAFPEYIETALFPPNTQLDLVISDCILSYEPRRESCWKLPMWSPVLPYSLVTTLWSPHASFSSWFLFLLSLCPPLERAHKRCSGRISSLLHKFSCPNFLVQPPRSCGWNDTPSIPIICRSTCLFRHFFWSPRARNRISTCQA